MKDCITKDFPALKKTDTAQYALSVMEDWKIRHLPEVDGDLYIGLLSEKDLSPMPDLSATIHDLVVSAPSIDESGHLHEVMARMARYHLTALPVVSSNGTYKGVVTMDKVFEALADLCHAEAPGSVLILEVSPRDYALSDIARIIEAHHAHALNLLSHTDPDTGRLLLTIKIDLEDATPVLRSFERFHYTVLRHFTTREMEVDEVLHRRIDELFHYINM